MLGLPFALLGLFALPALWWLHRRARPKGDRPFSAYYLVEAAEDRERQGLRLRARGLLAVRMAATVALVAAAVSVQPSEPSGTLVLAARPFEISPEWSRPLIIVRVGSPPTLVARPEQVEPVASRPTWGASLALGRTKLSRSRVVRVPPLPLTAQRVTSAGAAIDHPPSGGTQVAITATTVGALEAPVVWVGEQFFPMHSGRGEWRFEGSLAPGPAQVALGDQRPWPLCLPYAGEITVARDGWPESVHAVLEVLPGVRRVDADKALWRPGKATGRAMGWSPFAPAVTRFEFIGSESNQGMAPLWPDGPLPPPGASVARWRDLAQVAVGGLGPLTGVGRVLYFAGDAPVIDQISSPAGSTVRFGFDPSDSDLSSTAGWPVLFADLLERERMARGRCRVIEAGRSLTLAALDVVDVVRPGGAERSITPVAGQLVLDGLDTVGVFRLTSSGIRAAVAVVPPLGTSSEPRADEFEALPGRTSEAEPRHTEPLLFALALLAIGALVSRRWTAPEAWVPPALVIVALLGLRIGRGEPGRVAVAVDVSGSMPQSATVEAVAAVENALGDHPRARIEGAAGVRRAGPTSGPSDPFEITNDSTLHAPLLSAANALAGPQGAIVLVSDGRAEDGPVSSTRPVFPLAVGINRPDAAVVGGRAVRLGGQVFVRARLLASKPVNATVHIGGERLDAALAPDRPRTVHASLAATRLPADGVITIRVEVPGDPVAENNQLPIPVEGAAVARALVMGRGATSWAKAAGFSVDEAGPASVAEGAVDLTQIRAIFIHDHPSEALGEALVERLEGWIAAGGMLVLAGRTRAFGPGGWAGRPIETLSPLVSDPRPPGAGRLGVALLLDRSGSMAREAGGIGQEGVGALASSLAAGLRGPGDQIAVVAFGMDATVMMPPTPVRRAADAALPVPSLARGGTQMMPGLLRAATLLETADVDARVIIAITDGRVVDEEDPQIRPRLSLAGTRVMAVLVGESPSRAPFADLAEASGGHVIEGSGDALPRLITEGLLKTSRGELLVDGGTVTPTPTWRVRVGAPPPPVIKRVRVNAHPRARILARVAGDPLVAEWSFGRGRIIALATDQWSLSPPAWSALLSPARAPAPTDATLFVEDGRLHLVGPPWDPPPPGPATLIGADGRVVETSWRPVGPGRAIAALPPGPVEVLRVTSPTARGAVQGRVTRPAHREFLQVGIDRDALAFQAALSGGRVLTAPWDLGPVIRSARHSAGSPVAPWLALMALVMLLVDSARWAGVLRVPRRQ